MRRIVIATDGSPGAWPAVEEGIELAAETGAEVVFVSARPPIPLVGDPYYQRTLSRQLARCRGALDAALAAAERAGVPAESELVEGAAADVILDVARAHEADLVVVGSRGHRPLTELVLGSVSRAVVERSPVPVMVVRRPARAAAAA